MPSRSGLRAAPAADDSDTWPPEGTTGCVRPILPAGLRPRPLCDPPPPCGCQPVGDAEAVVAGAEVGAADDDVAAPSVVPAVVAAGAVDDAASVGPAVAAPSDDDGLPVVGGAVPVPSAGAVPASGATMARMRASKSLSR